MDNNESNHFPQFHNPNPISNTSPDNKDNHKPAMEKFKEAVINFADSNPSLFQNVGRNSYLRLIEQRFSQFFHHFQTPNHPPYAAMIHRAIRELNEKGGSSEESISNYIKQEYDELPWAHSTLLRHHLEKLCDRKEICISSKQCYSFAGADSDPISSSTSEEKQRKRKQNSEVGKKSSRHCKKRKKLKSRQDSELDKTSSRHCNKCKKKEERELDLQETNKQIIEVFQEEDQFLQLLNGVADEQENITCNGLYEPKFLRIEDKTYELRNNLTNMFVQEEVEESGVCAKSIEQNQSEIGKDGVGEKLHMITHSDVTGNKNQSVERPNDEVQIEIHGTKKGQLKRKGRLMSKRRSSKRGKKHEINEETQLQVLSEAALKQHNDVTDSESHEQNQMIEDNTIDVQIQQQNEAGAQYRPERRQNGVAEEVAKDGEMAHNAHPHNSGCISSGQIQMKQNTQLLRLEESPDSNPTLLESKHLGRRVWTRSHVKTMSKKDASESSVLMESPGYANISKDKYDVVEYVSGERQQAREIIGGKEVKQAPNAVSAQMNGQRAKLRSWQKNTGDTLLLQMESHQKSKSTSLERSLTEPILKKLRRWFPDLGGPTTAPSSTEGQELDSFQQDQQPDGSEDQPKYQGRGRHLQLATGQEYKALCNSESADVSQKCPNSYVEEDKPKYKGRGRHPMPKEPEKDEVWCDSKSAAILKKGQQSAEKSKVRSSHPKPKGVEDKVLCNSKSTDILQQVKQ